ncbi:MAG: DUF1553 domain-containing protein [Gemmataceae bacterium]|nr:DUF1553 domain-containing protein [Gemmataceae bacterium]
MNLSRSFHLYTLLGLSLVVSLTGSVQAQEKLPPNAKLARIEAFPTSVALKNPFEYRQLLLTGVLENGERIDMTRMVQAEKPANLVNVSTTGLVRPLADGKGELKFSLAGQSIAVPVEITGQKDKYEASFVKDVMPTMSKMGCNAGTCHGAQNGKNGFKLSLRGYDPAFDYRALTDDETARRFNRAAPDKSLMLLKPAGAVPHIGGALTQPGEPYYELLRLWIAEGVKLDDKAARVQSIDIFPKGPVVPLIGMKQQMAIIATFSDGSVRDVTAEAFIESSNTEVATADKAGLITGIRRGEGAMLARYEGAYAATTLIVMGDRSAFAWKETPVNNWIDTLVHEKLKSVKVLPSDICTDSEFIRRVTIDLTGLPPEPDAVRTFLNDNRPTRQKRDELVDKLVGSPDFVEHWTNKWADLLQVNRKFLGDKGATEFRAWIHKALAENMPYDKFAYAILTATGSNVDNPPASYFKTLRTPDAVMENTTHLFLAIRFNCNKCHDHPFERWTQDQYYHLAAYFARVGRGEDPKYKGQRIGGSAVEGALPLVEIISDVGGGDVKHERTGAVAPPLFPFKHAGDVPEKASRREQLARWITAKENPYFAKSYVNRIWSYLLGVGIIEPVDDIRAGNPASNPKLLDRLTEEFVANGFNVRQVMSTICKSRTYQHSLTTNDMNKDDEVNYSHALARRLPAEVLYDAIHRATGSVSRLPGLPAGARAAQLVDSNVPIPGSFLEQFGRPPRESACECERSSGLMLGPVLNLVNGPVLGEAIKDPNNRLAKLVAENKDDQKLIQEVFLSVLCRQPTEKELAKGVQALKDADADYDLLLAEYRKKADALTTYEKSLSDKQAAWEKNLKTAADWTTLDPATLTSRRKATLTKQPDGSILVSGPKGNPEDYTLTFDTKLAGVTAFRLEVLADPSLPAQGPGRADNGNFVLTNFKVLVAPKDKPEQAKQVTLQRAQADFSQQGFAVTSAINNANTNIGWAVSPQLGKSHVAVFETKDALTLGDNMVLTIKLEHQSPHADHSIGKFRLATTTAKPPISLMGPPAVVAKVLAIEPDKRSDAEKAELTRYFRSLDAELARLQREANDAAVPSDKRLLGVQDLTWALINSPAFLFNH